MKRYLAIILIGLVGLLAPGQTLAQASVKDETNAVEKIKTKITRLGVGEKARAQIKLRNGQKIKGYVSSSNQDNFTFTERGSGKTSTIAYGDVIEVKKPGLSRGAKIAIAVGIGVAALALIAIHVRNHLFDDFRLGN